MELKIILLIIAVLFSVVSTTKVEAVSKDDNEAVQLCKFLVGFVQNSVEDTENYSDSNQLTHQMYEVCQYIPENLKEICHTIVTDYSLLENVVGHVSSDIICQPLESYKEEEEEEIKEIDVLEKVEQPTTESIENSNKENKVTKIEEVDKNGNRYTTDQMDCNLCKYLVSQIDGYLKENKTQDEILDILEQSCSIVGSMASDCKYIVATYGPEVIQKVINNEKSPEVVCIDVGICKSTTSGSGSSETSGSGANKLEELHSHNNGIECPVCQYLASEITDYLSQNQSQSIMIQELYQDCLVFRDPTWIYICKEIVNIDGIQLVKDVKSTGNEELSCQMIGRCGGSSSSGTGTGNSGGGGATSSTGYSTGSGDSGGWTTGTSGDSGSSGYAYKFKII